MPRHTHWRLVCGKGETPRLLTPRELFVNRCLCLLWKFSGLVFDRCGFHVVGSFWLAIILSHVLQPRVGQRRADRAWSPSYARPEHGLFVSIFRYKADLVRRFCISSVERSCRDEGRRTTNGIFLFCTARVTCSRSCSSSSRAA